MIFDSELKNKIINRILILTMEGEIKWSSLDVLDIQGEIYDKDDLLYALENSKDGIIKGIKKDINFLALKGYDEERINNFIARKESKLREIKKRIEFVSKTKKRLVNRMANFDLKLSRGWYVDFTIINDSLFKNLPCRLIIRKRVNDESINYDGGIIRAIRYDTIPMDNFINSEDYPNIYTLGILLKKEDRVLRASLEKYKLEI